MIRHMMVGAAMVSLVSACANHGRDAGLAPADVPEPPLLSAEDTVGEAINAALLSEARPKADRDRDEQRKPEAVLRFMDLEPGDTLLEMEAGNGYFTEIFSSYLGPDGMLYMQNPAAFDAFLGDSVEERLEGLDNVEYVRAQFDDMPLEDGSVDAVTWFQGPHELWYTPEGGTELVGDIDAAFPEVFRVLKSGGSFVVIDHSAPDGAPSTTGGDTHRIDPQIVRDMATEAGFVFVDESSLFDNPEDDLQTSVFDENIRGKTDQFLMKFEKP